MTQTSTRARSPTCLETLQTDGLIARAGGGFRTTPRWQGAMARAALRLYAQGDAGEDLRVPVAVALLEIYSVGTPDDVLAGLVEAMLPIELHSLGLV